MPSLGGLMTRTDERERVLTEPRLATIGGPYYVPIFLWGKMRLLTRS
jgi:hypothetical protein